MSLFRLDGPVFQFLERIANLILLNLIFLIFCLPIVTIGPSLTALYSVSMKLVRKEETGIARDFLQAFRLNFRQGCLLFLIFLGCGILLAADIFLLLYSPAIPEAYASPLLTATFAVILLLLLVACYAFPLLARFHVTLGNCLRFSLGMAFTHIPTTIGVVSLAILPLFALFLTIAQILHIFLPILFLIGFSVISYCQSWFLLRAFRRYTPEESETGNASDPPSL